MNNHTDEEINISVKELLYQMKDDIEEQIKNHSNKLSTHDDKIEGLEKDQARVTAKIESVCDQLKQLIGIMKWYIGLSVGALVSFFMWVIQHSLLK